MCDSLAASAVKNDIVTVTCGDLQGLLSKHKLARGQTDAVTEFSPFLFVRIEAWTLLLLGFRRAMHPFRQTVAQSHRVRETCREEEELEVEHPMRRRLPGDAHTGLLTLAFWSLTVGCCHVSVLLQDGRLAAASFKRTKVKKKRDVEKMQKLILTL